MVRMFISPKLFEKMTNVALTGTSITLQTYLLSKLMKHDSKAETAKFSSTPHAFLSEKKNKKASHLNEEKQENSKPGRSF